MHGLDEKNENSCLFYNGQRHATLNDTLGLKESINEWSFSLLWLRNQFTKLQLSQDSDIWYFSFKKIYMIIIWLKGKQWFDRTQKCWHFLLLRNQDFKYCIIWYVARASTCKKTRFESSWTDYNHQITLFLFFPLVQCIHVTIF